ncbi:MAG: DUF805 domain-containing protein [Syntrophorhabdaceae bacterium]|nr:DUF805 domain-containing protein [Syntrophorhabdaceae bacterium]
MEWYKMFWRRYADFSGRSRRSEFWYAWLFMMITAIILTVIDSFVIVSVLGFPLLTILFWLASIVPSIAIVFRRLHDIGKSAWWIFIGLVPVVGGFIVLYYYVKDSQPGSNQYGPNPKGA